MREGYNAFLKEERGRPPVDCSKLKEVAGMLELSEADKRSKSCLFIEVDPVYPVEARFRVPVLSVSFCLVASELDGTSIGSGMPSCVMKWWNLN